MIQQIEEGYDEVENNQPPTLVDNYSVSICELPRISYMAKLSRVKTFTTREENSHSWKNLHGSIAT